MLECAVIRLGRLRTSLVLATLSLPLGLGASARADVPSTPGSAALRVWYRSSEGCPDGAAFIDRLARLGRSASLASVGDRVDFVVTLAHTPELSRGRLERQSDQRTVAIRDVESLSCDEVADALALSLELSLQPVAEDATTGPTSAISSDAAPGAGEEHEWNLWLGAQARFETGLARAALPGVAVFVALSPRRSGPSGRLSLRAARGVRELDTELALSLLAARPEACMQWGSATLHVGPCAGIDVGVVFAQTSGAQGYSDSGVWTSATGLVRGHWQFGRALSLEAQVGAIIPFIRYRFDTRSGSEVADSAAAGVEAALGVAFLLDP
jgi:hypothetical protein